MCWVTAYYAVDCVQPDCGENQRDSGEHAEHRAEHTVEKPLSAHHLVEGADVEERHVGIDRTHPLTQRLPRLSRAAARPRDQRHAARQRRILPVRDVDDGIGFSRLVVHALTDILCHADDGQPRRGRLARPRSGESDLRVDGVLPLEIHIDEPLVDDHALTSWQTVGSGKGAPLCDGDAKGVEVSRPDAEQSHRRPLVFGDVGLTGELELSPATASTRQVGGGRERLDVGRG